MELEGVKYDAFISYRHCELDSFVAENLHKRLENFKLPKSVIKKKGLTRTRIERVFRDVEELPLSDNLSDPIGNALMNSGHLIVIATPRLKESRWCMQEISTFLKYHNNDREKVLMVLAEGEPEDSFPTILTYAEVTRTDVDGTPIVIKEGREPLAADTRGSTKKEILKTMDTAVTKLCAAMFGLNYDDLKQRRREQKIKRLVTIGSIVGAAVLGFAIFATVSLLKISAQNKVITSQYIQLEDKYASQMATASNTLLKSGRRLDALYAARSVLPDTAENGYNASAFLSLSDAAALYDSYSDIFPVMTYDVGARSDDYEISADDRLIAISDYSGFITIFETETGKKLHTVEAGTTKYIDAFSFCGKTGFVYLTSDGEVCYFDVLKGKDKKLFEDAWDAVIVSSDDGAYTICFENEYLHVIGEGGEVTVTADINEVTKEVTQTVTRGASMQYYWFDGNVLAISMSSSPYVYTVVVDLDTGSIIDAMWLEDNVVPAVCVKGDILYFAFSSFGDNRTYVYAWDIKAAQTLWKAEFAEYITVHLKLCDDFLWIYGDNSVMTFNINTGTILSTFYFSDRPVNVYTDETGNIYYISENGKWYNLTPTNTTDLTTTFYPVEVGENVLNCEAVKGSFYYQFHKSNYIVRYGNIKDVEPEPAPEYRYTSKWSADLPADDELDSLKGINPKMVKSIFYSDDKEYIAVEKTDSTVSVFDAETKKECGTFDSGRDLYRLTKVNDDMYVASGHYFAYVLNSDFEIIGNCGALYESDGDKMVLYSGSDIGYMKYDIYSYEEAIAKADELLGDYVPSDDICKKYSITVKDGE